MKISSTTMAPIQIDTEASKTIPLGEYLFNRIADANPKLRSIFGIPGDFNLNLLEHLYSDSVLSREIRFINTCNELNGAYAADGYARAIEGLSVLITTYGVGELSALNGISGSFAEYVPVLHIVGTTSTQQVAAASTATPATVKNIHHLVQLKIPTNAPDHDVYKRLVEDFSVATETLYKHDAASVIMAKIDHVLKTIIRERRPGYLFIPSDVPDDPLPERRRPTFDISELKGKSVVDVAAKILAKLYKAEKPAVLGDALVSRFGASKEFKDFIDLLPEQWVRLFNTNMGRLIDDTRPNVVGTYYGVLSPDARINRILEDDTDLLLNFGFLNVETNTAGNSWDFSQIDDYVEIHPDYVLMDGVYHYHKDYTTGERLFSLGDLISEIVRQANPSQFKLTDNITYKFAPKTWANPGTEHISQNKLIDFFNHHLRPNDILVVETCTFLFGVPDIKFPPGVKVFSQLFYGSIGYALPATLGVSAAVKDLGATNRVILVQGDGSAQMTIQELSTFLRFDVAHPQIFLLNNSGYTVERIIKGPTRSYNDIQDTWKWTDFFKIFGDADGKMHTSTKLRTAVEFDAYFAEEHPSDKIEFIELILGKLDAPERFAYLSGSKPMPKLK